MFNQYFPKWNVLIYITILSVNSNIYFFFSAWTSKPKINSKTEYHVMNIDWFLIRIRATKGVRAYPWILIKYLSVSVCVCVCVWVCVTLQKRLGVSFFVMEVSLINGYFGKFNYFIQPHVCSHILCAHNLFSPAWYIDSYLYWDVNFVPSPSFICSYYWFSLCRFFYYTEVLCM